MTQQLRGLRRGAAVALALTIVLGACAPNARRGTSPTTPTSQGIPSDCTGVDVAASPEKVTFLQEIAQTFNQRRVRVDGKCVFVRINRKSSGAGQQALAAGWDEKRDGPLPAIWSPAGGGWGAVLNQNLSQRGEREYAPAAYRSLMRTALVFAMPRPMAEALGWPQTEIGFADIIALARDPQGWAAKNHPEWGAFKLGKTNPNFSTSGLNATIATYYAATGKTTSLTSDDVSSPKVKEYVAGVEASVVHYGDTTLTFLANQYREDQRGRGLTYISAVTVEEKSILDFNRGDPEGKLPPDRTGPLPRIPLVAIYPKEGTLFSDNPLYVLDAPWMTRETRSAAEAFVDFAAGDREVQARALAFGFRPGLPEVPLGSPITTGNYLDPAKPTTVLEVPRPATVARVLQAWEETRKRARVLLVIDVSGSMGDLVTRGETKLDLAKEAVVQGLGSFQADDQVGLWVFTTDLPNDTDHQELVPIANASQTVEQIRGKVSALTPLNGTPLYSATEAAVRRVQETHDPMRINAVVLLSDGQNEDERNNDKAGLLQRLGNLSKESQKPVRIFPISYGKDADLATLRQIAEATDSAVYDSSDPAAIVRVFETVISNF